MKLMIHHHHGNFMNLKGKPPVGWIKYQNWIKCSLSFSSAIVTTNIYQISSFKYLSCSLFIYIIFQLLIKLLMLQQKTSTFGWWWTLYCSFSWAWLLLMSLLLLLFLLKRNIRSRINVGDILWHFKDSIYPFSIVYNIT